ncbi:MAG: NUDIX domain-containing protein [Ferruginibacter sp.]
MKKSAGILLFRKINTVLEILLVHPGGPFWKNKDLGSWSIPKGEFSDEETALNAAKREFKEETGITIKEELLPLSPVKQKSGKLIYAWAAEKNIDAAAIKSNQFEMEWPPKSGQLKHFPEIDKAQWFSPEEAMQKINSAQAVFITELQQLLSVK